jgi:hypothetical protein
MSEPIPLVYEYQMSAREAFKLMRREGLINRLDAKVMRSFVMAYKPIPDRLYPQMEMLFLLRALPPTDSLH